MTLSGHLRRGGSVEDEFKQRSSPALAARAQRGSSHTSSSKLAANNVVLPPSFFLGRRFRPGSRFVRRRRASPESTSEARLGVRLPSRRARHCVRRVSRDACASRRRRERASRCCGSRVVAPLGVASRRGVRENGHVVAGLAAVTSAQTKSIVVAIDRSQSMRGGPLANAVAAAQSFAPRPAATTTSALSPSAAPRSPSPAPRRARRPPRDQLGGITVDSRSGTALYDAVVVAADRLAGDERPRPRDRRRHRWQGRLQPPFARGCGPGRAAARGPPSTRSASPARDFTSDALRELAAQTGGTYHEASSSHDLAATYASVQAELARTVAALVPHVRASRTRSSAHRDRPGRRRGATSTPRCPATARARPTRRLARSPASRTAPAGPAAIGLAVGGLILLACCFWFASQRASRLRAAHRAAPRARCRGRRSSRRQQGTRRDPRAARRLDRARVRERAASSSRSQRMIERADLPLRPGELVAICAGVAFALGLVRDGRAVCRR